LQVKKKKEEEETPPDPKAVLMADMYVCMGNAPTTDADAWYATARMATETATSSSRPTSARSRPLSSTRPTSARPTSASAYSDYQRSDSGLGHSTISSAKHGPPHHRSRVSEDILNSKLFASEGKLAPRVTDELCMITKDRPHSSVVYATPKPDPLAEFIDEDCLGILDDSKDRDDEKDSGKGDDENVELNDSLGTHAPQNIAVEDIDEAGSVIVGVVLKSAVSKLSEMGNSEIEKLPGLQQYFNKSKSCSELTLESLDKVTFVKNEETVAPSSLEADEPLPVPTGPKVPGKAQEDESDVDSLLDSEEDYEEADTFFRKHKHRTFNLTNRKVHT